MDGERDLAIFGPSTGLDDDDDDDFIERMS